MVKVALPDFLSDYYQNSFNLKQHLQEFLHLDSETLEKNLSAGQQKLAELGHRDFDWETATNFYRDKVGEMYLFELGAWHLECSLNIENTLFLIADNAKGRLLDFGGGIGTHTICAALCPQVEQVIYCDINPINLDFVSHRAEQLGLSHKISFCSKMPSNETFDTIISFDVLEHLSDPCEQLLSFYRVLKPEGKTILNWHFFKGFNQEYPFHLDDPQVVESFFKTIQSKFLEVFHPYYTTARCYRKWI
ncbi:bifunctional 2-polyprenyl-6-hydroxyphenol methylase/3-demethylubiquinol 3-O-methyltransferase UbiG [Sphaerospermopsis sp. LEGE 08334]|uniref:class I SAM-dependent methyltransferase n=1 Tax=Sphaerospermopsis sp. LEGE 08334 TaxID=1828651 RepID=UPI001881E4CA|nr:class I SAM-dependent methyltransferase [Sphaerospermopsis sp. LEGE 08334]MBE9058403.1 class I SAM-dependent methyltransferase [Sphaerospermopsis sp. LEGE 08334]